MMRYKLLPIITAATFIIFGCAPTEEAVDPAELGLSKTDVTETPDPIVPVSSAAEPGESRTMEPYFEGSPPMIPHAIADFLPISMDNNACAECHVLPDEIGKERSESDPVPAPASHFTDMRNAPGEVTKQLIGARFVCTQCHAPQTDSAPLVVNTYGD